MPLFNPIFLTESEMLLAREDTEVFLEKLKNLPPGLDIPEAVINLLLRLGDVSPYLTWLLALQMQVAETTAVWDTIHKEAGHISYAAMYHLLQELTEMYKGVICGRA